MKDRKVKFGVVGASPMGMNHIRSIFHHPKLELVAICDKEKDRVEAAGAETGVTALYTDWHDLIADPNVEAVVLCIPDGWHAEMTEAALAAGKDVLCEKPMALTMEECERMRNAEKKYGNKLMVGQLGRCCPAFRLTKELIDRGEIGELYFVESEYAHDYLHARGMDDWRVDARREPYIGGGCHAVDLLRWIAGNPTEITAYSNHKCLTDWPVNDCTISILRFPNNVIGKVFVSIGCKRDYTMRSCFYGTKGTIICDNTSNHITIYKEDLNSKDSIFTGTHANTKVIPVQLPVTISNHNTYSELEGFAESIVNDTPVPCSSYDGECTVTVCIAAMESARSGKPVVIQYPEP